MPNWFDMPPNMGVLVCTRVLEGGPILRVSRDDEGDWQFLCDADHSMEGVCPPKFVSISEVVKRHPDIVELSDLCITGSASRADAGEPWTRYDEAETAIHKNVRKYGWHATMIEEDDEGPGFLYSIGVFKSWRKPELILFGSPMEMAHTLITTAVDRMKDGESFPLDAPVDRILKEYPVMFKAVHASQFHEYFGYGLWYYDGPKFPALQCFLPDKTGKFPWDPGCAKAILSMQPDLSRPR